MSNDPVSLSALASVVLRLALGAIFVYHGLGKISGPSSDLGANWAFGLWTRQANPPPGLMERVERLPKRSEEEIKQLKEELWVVYQREKTELPTSLRLHAIQMAVAWGELVGGIALVLGLLTRLSALLLVVIQMGAITTVTWEKGFSFAEGGGYEYNLALIAMCLATALLGGGRLSVDRCWRAWRKDRAKAAVQEPATGVAAVP